MMRAHCPPGGPASSTFLQADPEHIIEKLESLVKELVMLKEGRKTAKFLGQCAQMAFPRMPAAEHKVLGERLLAACEHIAVKRKSATTGKKTAPAVYRIIMAMNLASLSLPVASTSSKSIASASKPSASTSKPSASTSKPSASTAASVESFYDSMLEAAEEEQPECTDEVVSVSSSDHDHTVQYLSTKDMAMVRICGGKKIVANMKPGDSGFCIATFDSGTEYETELPNSTYLKFEDVQKKPSMNSNKKRPAACVSTAEVSTKKKKSAEVAAEVTASSPALHLQAATQEYVVMLYKSPPAWAIRERCGQKKQVFSIPVKDRTPEQMLSLVKGAIQRLTSGEDKESVKAWARAWKPNIYSLTALLVFDSSV